MPDVTDAVQRRRDLDNSEMVAAARARQEPPARVCVCGCGALVEPDRFAVGACRTFECQERHDARERLYGRLP